MSSREGTSLTALLPTGGRIRIWTATAEDAEAVAEGLYEARPHWRLCIEDKDPVFSREGKVVDLIRRRAPRG